MGSSDEVEALRTRIQEALQGSDADLAEALMDEALDIDENDELDDLLIELEMHVSVTPAEYPTS